eukprot:8503478-Pyramimonas_sp.AAC.1
METPAHKGGITLLGASHELRPDRRPLTFSGWAAPTAARSRAILNSARANLDVKAAPPAVSISRSWDSKWATNAWAASNDTLAGGQLRATGARSAGPRRSLKRRAAGLRSEMSR